MLGARIVRILTHEEAKRKAVAEELMRWVANYKGSRADWDCGVVDDLITRARELAPWVRWR